MTSRSPVLDDLLGPLLGSSRLVRIVACLLHTGLPLLGVGLLLGWLAPRSVWAFGLGAAALLVARAVWVGWRGGVDPAEVDRRLGLGDRLRTLLDHTAVEAAPRLRAPRGEPAFVGWLRRDVDDRLRQVAPRQARRVGWRPLGRRGRLVAALVLLLLLLRLLLPVVPEGVLPIGGPGSGDLLGSAPAVALAGDPAPAAPTGLTATVGGLRVDLGWDEHPEADVIGYRLYRADKPTQAEQEAAGGELPLRYRAVHEGLLSERTAIDPRLDEDAQFAYVVTAWDRAGQESPPSEPVEVPDSGGGGGAQSQPDPEPQAGSDPNPPPEPEQSDPPGRRPGGDLLDDLPSRVDFVAPSFVGDGPSQRDRAPAVGLDEGPQGGSPPPPPPPRTAGGAPRGLGGMPPEPGVPAFERAREQALRGRHVRPEERDFVRAWFTPGPPPPPGGGVEDGGRR